MTLDEFVSMQEMKVRTESRVSWLKNLEVETAVEDLIFELARFPYVTMPLRWIRSRSTSYGCTTTRCSIRRC